MARSFGRPSSTITAASLAMSATTVFVEACAQFGYELRPSFAAALVMLAGALTGYVKKENVLPLAREE